VKQSNIIVHFFEAQGQQQLLRWVPVLRFILTLRFRDAAAPGARKFFYYKEAKFPSSKPLLNKVFLVEMRACQCYLNPIYANAGFFLTSSSISGTNPNLRITVFAFQKRINVSIYLD
jgi:hypothetical protein